LLGTSPPFLYDAQKDGLSPRLASYLWARFKHRVVYVQCTVRIECLITSLVASWIIRLLIISRYLAMLFPSSCARYWSSKTLVLGWLVAWAAAFEGSSSRLANDESLLEYLQTASRAGDEALRASAGLSPHALGAAILYAPVAPTLETAVAVTWRALTAADPGCRPLVAVGVVSDHQSSSVRRPWPWTAASSRAAMPCPAPRVLRAVVSTAGVSISRH